MKVSRDCFAAPPRSGTAGRIVAARSVGKSADEDELTARWRASVYRPRWTSPCPPQSTYLRTRFGNSAAGEAPPPPVLCPDGYVWAAPEDLAEVYPVPNAFGAYVKAK